MLLPRNQRQIISSAFLLVLTVGIWVLFAPIQFGGDVAYVILSGNSMSPKYVLGDLVVVRRQADYKIGEIVTYQHPDIGYVFHRIVAIDASGHFVLQGDHNTWRDSYHPSRDEIVGKFWFYTPKAGKTLEDLRSPWGFAILTLVFVLLFFIIIFPSAKKRIHRDEDGRGYFMSDSYKRHGENLFILAVLAFGALALGVASFRQPLFNEITTPLKYEQKATFHYTANVPSEIYDSEQIQSGEPIFRRLNTSFSVGLNYALLSEEPADISGTYTLNALVSDGSGWKRTLVLVPQTPFEGNTFTVSEKLILSKIQSFIDTLEKETGIERGRYTLTILSEIEIEGTLHGLALKDSFSPAIRFDMTNLEVVLQNSGEEGKSVLTPSQENALMLSTYEKNTLNLLGIKLPVLVARWISLAIGIPSFVFLFLLLFRLYTAAQNSEVERARVWYGSMLVETRDFPHFEGSRQVEIASLDDLAHFAEQEQRPILHLSDDDWHHFFVQTPMRLYHYQIEESIAANKIMPPPDEEKIWTTRLPWRRQTLLLEDSYTRALEGWAQAVESRFYKEGHAAEVAEMAKKLAESLGIRGKALKDIHLGAYLRDIGFMNISERIIRKKKKLTQKEWEIVRTLPVQAKERLAEVNLRSSVVDIVHYHHERWDGSGYPKGLEGEEIPLGARIVAIVEVWNALKNPRPYRDAWTSEEILQYFRKESGIQFDPKVTEAFCNLLQDEFPDEYEEIIEAETEVQDEDPKKN